MLTAFQGACVLVSWAARHCLYRDLLQWVSCLQGKGLGFGAVADFVHSLKIVLGNGAVEEYDSSHPYFNDARMNFGLMGVIVEIVFALSSKRVAPELPIVYDNNTFPTLRELFGRPDAAAYIKASPLVLTSSCTSMWYKLTSQHCQRMVMTAAKLAC